MNVKQSILAFVLWSVGGLLAVVGFVAPSPALAVTTVMPGIQAVSASAARDAFGRAVVRLLPGPLSQSGEGARRADRYFLVIGRVDCSAARDRNLPMRSPNVST